MRIGVCLVASRDFPIHCRHPTESLPPFSRGNFLPSTQDDFTFDSPTLRRPAVHGRLLTTFWAFAPDPLPALFPSNFCSLSLPLPPLPPFFWRDAIPLCLAWLGSGFPFCLKPRPKLSCFLRPMVKRTPFFLATDSFFPLNLK